MTLALTDVEFAAVSSVWVAGGRELTAAFGGTSMLPAIAPGQRLVLHCGTEPGIGEVAAYLLQDRIVVHRLVARSTDESWFLAWGDANALPDPPFSREKLIGTIAAIEQSGALAAVPPLPPSLKRTVLLRFIAAPSSKPASVAGRVRLMYRLRDNLALSLPALLSKLVKRLARRTA